MTADADKGNVNVVCLICNASIGVSTRNSCPIFKYNVTSSEQPVANILSVILGQEVRQELVHSEIICKKCFKLCNEVDELQERLAEIKIEINNYYQKTLRKLEGHMDEDEDLNSSQVIILSRNNKVTPLSSNSGLGGKRGRPRKYPLSEGQNSMKHSLMNSMEEIIVGESDEDDPQGIGVGLDDDNDSDYAPDPNKPLRKVEEALLAGTDGVHIKVEVLDDEENAAEALRKKQNSQSPIKKNSNTPDLPSIIPQMIVSRSEKNYTCLLCSAENKVQGEAKAITLHMKAEHNIRLYICDMCGLEFLKRSEMSAHFDQHVANEEGDFQCDICNRIFSNLRLFRVHKRMHLPQAKNHICETCGKGYLSRNMLEEHYNTHTGNRPYKCSECGKDFASKYTLRAHEKTHTDRPRPYKCGQCGKGFITEQNLIQHDRTHSAVRNFTCQICGKAFSSARNLEVHCVIHTGYKPFICRICGKAFARKAEIRDHERTHTGEKPYQCEFCGATFGQRSNLQSHKRATHYDDKRYQCVDCGKAFKRRRLLDYHIKAAHTGERPFKCQVCGATFIYPEHFKKHRRIHTGEKPYQCEVCGKAFNSRDNRNAHRFIHSDKKPYECLVCGMGFMRKPQLYNHMQVQGHVNDTIVVNQPRLTTEEDLIPQADEVEMAIITEPDGTHNFIHPDQVHEVHERDGDTKMFISELKEHVIIQSKGGEQVVVDDEQHYNEVGHLIIDGQIVDQETLELEGAADGTTALVVRGAEIGPDGTTQVQTADGQVHLVQISIPDSDQPAWFNIVQQ